MNNKIYHSDRHFTLFDFLISHGQLLLRSQKNSNHKKNIDIVFFGTGYIQISSIIPGIEITNFNGDLNPVEYQSVRKFLNHTSNYLFEVKSNNEIYLIGASYFRVFENELEFWESSLTFDTKRGIEIFSSFED